ncbi:MAG: hypothetical protein IBJ18_00400 [Phycisphaerales bacterium]|nr:hypothetical protein [Phycisphaerales bacterium]
MIFRLADRLRAKTKRPAAFQFRALVASATMSALVGGGMARAAGAPGDEVAKPAEVKDGSADSSSSTKMKTATKLPPGRVVVKLRHDSATMEGELVSFTPGGLHVRLLSRDATPGHEVVISLDRIREVEGIDEARLALIGPVMDGLWRGRSRLEREDYEFAEKALMPIFDALSERGGLTGPSGSVLAEGVLRIRLNKGWTGAALQPWLLWRVAQEAGGRLGLEPGPNSGVGAVPTQRAGYAEWIGGEVARGVLLDRYTGLCVQLPPMFAGSQSERALTAALKSPVWGQMSSTSGSTSRMAALYQAAIEGEIALSRGQEFPLSKSLVEKSDDPGVQLVAEIVQSRLGDGVQRAEARVMLEGRLTRAFARRAGDGEGPSLAMPAWQEAWIRAAIGRSLLREESPRIKRQGLVSMLHVPARMGESQPWLAALVLRDAAEAMKTSGDVNGAKRLLQDLASRLGDYADDESQASLAGSPGSGVGAVKGEEKLGGSGTPELPRTNGEPKP